MLNMSVATPYTRPQRAQGPTELPHNLVALDAGTLIHSKTQCVVGIYKFMRGVWISIIATFKPCSLLFKEKKLSEAIQTRIPLLNWCSRSYSFSPGVNSGPMHGTHDGKPVQFGKCHGG